MRITRQEYSSPVLREGDCGLWSGLCAESVVTPQMFNIVQDPAQEKGQDIDIANDSGFNHNWEEGA